MNYRGYPLGRPLPAPLRWLLAPLGRIALRGHRRVTYVPYQPGGRLLDFGCGTGLFVAQMNAAGWQAEGLDLSPDSIARGREMGLTLHHGTLPGIDLKPESFDALTMWHSLEHVPSPKATLQAAYDLLRPGGLLVVTVPRLDSVVAEQFGAAWYGLGLPLHLAQFTRKSLLAYLDATGFEPRDEINVVRASWLRLSYGYRADDTGHERDRRMSKSRVLTGLQKLRARRTGRTQQLVVLAQRRS